MDTPQTASSPAPAHPLSIEYQYGFCEPCATAEDAAAKIRAACVHDETTLFPKRIEERPGYCIVSFLEQLYAGRQQRYFVASVFGSREQLERVIELIA